MDGRLVRQISELGDTGDGDVVKELEQMLTEAAGGSLTVKAARDTFTKVLGKVRGGDMQVIGRKTEDMAVMISLKDLAALIRSSARTMSFGSALDEVGFKPLGRRIKVRKGVDGPALRRPRKVTKNAAPGMGM
ncbi:type II toxin-antitoxin system Phd/YefM family antitoxin [Rhizobium laguerreae]|uniref:type II toxin-antitoxin system Phd/YefM family antitoxin n=1 Tax=Rhizobium laguerreae TaxID=1076926 RepID=UPI001C922AF2|nr:type II toxin-antitoxin system Phd/YefM family antitoxin [Rhizobium laguerreae]MBY3155212.1 type II toxin-antitoxin system Phd/YefM family antitoxin [Rhizobium laguerreae]MBY3432739.1 type II toxin-antitoxin system Phd/YefM family antitoxin [Rhizobium laguerreae]